MPDGRPGGVIRTSQLDSALGLARHSGVDAAEQAPHPPSGARAGGLRPHPSRSSVKMRETPLFSLGCSYSQEVSSMCTHFGEEPVFPA